MAACGSTKLLGCAANCPEPDVALVGGVTQELLTNAGSLGIGRTTGSAFPANWNAPGAWPSLMASGRLPGSGFVMLAR